MIFMRLTLTPAGQTYFQAHEVSVPDWNGKKNKTLSLGSGQYRETHARWYGALYKVWTSADEAYTLNGMEIAEADTVTYYTVDPFTLDSNGVLLLLKPEDHNCFLEVACGFRVAPDDDDAGSAIMVQSPRR